MSLRAYLAPEALFNLQYGTAFDMWSAGCILAELFKGVPLFLGPKNAGELRNYFVEKWGVHVSANGIVEKDRSVPIENLLPDNQFNFNDEVL